MTEPAAPHPRLDVNLPSDLEPVYANLVLMVHSSSEFFLDFAQMLPQVPHARIRARILMTPLTTKRLLRVLLDQVARFESRYGEIAVPLQDSGLADQLFQPVGPDKPEGE